MLPLLWPPAGGSLVALFRSLFTLSHTRTSPNPPSPPPGVRTIDRFFLGGPTSLRGFQERGVGPRAPIRAVSGASPYGDALGGDVSALASVALQLPLPSRRLQVRSLLYIRLWLVLVLVQLEGEHTRVPRSLYVHGHMEFITLRRGLPDTPTLNASFAGLRDAPAAVWEHGDAVQCVRCKPIVDAPEASASIIGRYRPRVPHPGRETGDELLVRTHICDMREI